MRRGETWHGFSTRDFHFFFFLGDLRVLAVLAHSGFDCAKVTKGTKVTKDRMRGLASAGLHAAFRGQLLLV
jgi:hypothetical protein